MATQTLGTSSTTRLPFAITWQRAGLLAADLATIRNHILNTVPQSGPANIWPGAFENGQIFLPNSRGVIRLVPGDVIGIGTTGWPIVIPAAAATADWTLT